MTPFVGLDVIYDCDNTMGHGLSEIDDGLTLLYLLGCDALRVVGVTTTFGNGPEAVVARQTRRLLEEVGRSDIPLLRGAKRAGDWDTEASAFIAERTQRDGAPLALLATGPLSNLAGAAARSPRLFQRVAKLGAMGGYLRPVRLGWRRLGELNISSDAAAAARVLTEAPAEVDTALFSTHVCLQARFGLREYLRLRRASGWPSHRLATVRNWLLRFGLRYSSPHFYLWDLLPALWLTSPEIFSGERAALRGGGPGLERGRLLLDRRREGSSLSLPSQIVERDIFYERLFDAWAKVEP